MRRLAFSRAPFAAMLAALAVGCGGGGPTGAPPDLTAPLVAVTSPVDGAGGVAPGATITVTFSEPMEGASLSTSTFLLARGGTPVPGTVTRGATTATFAPAAPLLFSTTYTATITTGAKDVAGNPLEASHAWSFTTAAPPLPPSGWSAQAIGTARNDFSVDIHGVDVDLNEGGTGIAVWEEASDSTGAGGVWVAWYRGGWEAASRITDVAETALLPRVALNDAGQAVIAYEVVDLDAYDWPRSRTIWARRWVDGAWTAAARISDASPGDGELYASRPRVGIDAQGRAMVVWDQQDALPRPNSILGARFDGAAWSAPFLVSDGVTYAAWADAAVSADGTAVAVWEQATNGVSGNVWARVFDGVDWAGPARIGPEDLVDYEWATRANAVMDATGRAFVVFEVNRTSGNRIDVARLLGPTGPTWSASEPLATSAAPTDHLSFPSIATDGAGDAFAVWQSDVPSGSDAHGAAARFDGAGGGWGAATFFETGGDVPYAVAAMGGDGNGWALYTPSALKARRHDPALGWQPVDGLGGGQALDAEANGSGMVIVGARYGYYSSSPLGFFVVARAAVYVP